LSGSDKAQGLEPVAGIRKLGFKRWFERQLIESHVYLVTFLLCLILVIAVFEQLGSRPGGLERALMYAAMIGGGAIGIVSLNRYTAILFRALHLAERSTCKNCGAYARFSVLDSTRGPIEDTADDREGVWLKVKCRTCGHEWTMA
jgi:hypothetical protein